MNRKQSLKFVIMVVVNNEGSDFDILGFNDVKMFFYFTGPFSGCTASVLVPLGGNTNNSQSIFSPCKNVVFMSIVLINHFFLSSSGYNHM